MEKPTNVSASALPIVNYDVRSVGWTIFFLAVAMVAPSVLAHTPNNQWITGTIVNAILFLAVWRVGLVNALIIGAIPSFIAFSRGLLPVPMAAMIPYIIFSNAILIFVFYGLYKKSKILGVIAASLAKSIWLFILASLIVPNAGPIIQMMSWPQLVTALAGGLVALGVIKLFSNKANMQNS